MFGFRFLKAQPTDFVLLISGGHPIRSGTGLSLLYFSPTTSVVLIPVGSIDAPFIFEEVTADFQQVTVQGQIIYKVSDPEKLARLMNYTLRPDGRGYASDDPLKLPQRLVQSAQVAIRAALQTQPLKDALVASAMLEGALRSGLQAAETLSSLGVQILGVSILAIRPTPETARALEASAREEMLRQADEAVYARRNAAVQQERAIRENELNTEIAVEIKKREIRETQMDAEKAVQLKQRELREAEMATGITLEQQKRQLVALAVANARDEADAKAYSMSTAVQAFSGADPKLLQALAATNMDPSQLIAAAFHQLADSAEKIGQLNISPELLRELLAKHPAH
jgi:hypothetical protein